MWKRLTSCFTCGRRDNDRSGSPEKLTNVSSSCDSDTPEQYAKQEASSKRTDFRVKPNGGNSFGYKNEGAQGIQNNEKGQSENLRRRLLANNSHDNGQDTKDETKANIKSNAYNELTNSSPKSEKKNIQAYEENLGDVLPVCEPNELRRGDENATVLQTICKTNNEEISDKTSGEKSTSETFESNRCNEEPVQFVQQEFVQDEVAESSKLKDNTQEEGNINNANDVLNEPLAGETSAIQKVFKQEILIEEEVKVNEVFISEAAVELKEESSVLVEGSGDDLIKEQQNIAGDLLSDDLNSEAIVNEVSKPPGIEEIKNDFGTENASHEQNGEDISNSMGENAAELNDENEKAISSMPSVEAISDQHINEAQPVIDNVVEIFSDQLSKCILATVLQDTQLLYNQSEDETVENCCKESVLKFSDILAESIVRSVVDFSKLSQGHVAEQEEHDHLSPNVAYASNKTNENVNQDVAYQSSPPNEEDIFSADEANDDGCCKNLHDYAKRLSQQIMSDVLDSHGQNGGSTRRSSTEVYASKLTESVLSTAINGAKSQIADSHSLPDSDIGIESALDLFIAEIVGNAVESAVSRIAKVTHRDFEEQRVNQGDPEGQEDVEEHVEGHIENLMDEEGHSGACNGEIESPSEDVNNEPSSASVAQPIQQNGKLQSKWLSEDDLDELYDDDLSDEEESVAKEPSKSIRTDNKEAVTSPNSLTTPDNEKQFWRRSLIEDLDDNIDFDDLETPRSSTSSNPTKPDHLEDFIVDESGGSDDEVLETTVSVKVQAPVVKATDSSRSRLRSVDTTPALVLDNGSAFLKIGFSDQALPKEIVSSVVGTPLRYSQDISGMEYSARPGLVFGQNAMGKAGVLHIEYPLKSDLIEKWSDVEGLWNYALGSLMCIQDNPDFPILISQPALNPKKNTEKIAEIMFEHFHMPSIFIADQLALSLFSMGYTSGLSFSSGFQSTQAGVVYEGHVLPHTVKQLDIAGYQLTENLKKLLMSLKGFGFRSSSQWQIVDDIKKKLGFFSLDFDSDSKRYKTQAELQTPYELPDGQIIEVGLERFGCAESLFRPMEVGLTQSPAHMLIIEAVNSCEEELQELCYKAMGVSGGTTQMNGFLDRLEQELRKNDRKFKNFTAPEHRDLSTWLGGSVVASLPTFREMVVTVDEYAESGARVVHSKCF